MVPLETACIGWVYVAAESNPREHDQMQSCNLMQLLFCVVIVQYLPVGVQSRVLLCRVLGFVEEIGPKTIIGENYDQPFHVDYSHCHFLPIHMQSGDQSSRPPC